MYKDYIYTKALGDKEKKLNFLFLLALSIYLILLLMRSLDERSRYLTTLIVTKERWNAFYFSTLRGYIITRIFAEPVNLAYFQCLNDNQARATQYLFSGK